jgi:hypothetical protein
VPTLVTPRDTNAIRIGAHANRRTIAIATPTISMHEPKPIARALTDDFPSSENLKGDGTCV